MLLRRSIRLKIGFGLALVTLILLTFIGSSISGLRSYGRVVKDLELSIETAPRNSELIAALDQLFEPLAMRMPAKNQSLAVRQRAGEEQLQQFQETLAIVRSQLGGFRSRFQALPSAQQRPSDLQSPEDLLFAQIGEQLDSIEKTSAVLANLEQREATDAEVYLIRQIATLLDVVQEFPDPAAELKPILAEARASYQTHLGLVQASGVAGCLMFILLAVVWYRGLFLPIRRITDGAIRVAKGDFDYRVRSGTDCDFSRLAGAFNSMTERFQHVADDLDRQVQERGKQLVQSERLAGVGFLAAGVAHEINNPLYAIAVAAESLSERVQPLLSHAEPGDAEVVTQYLEMMQTEAYRCREITEKLLDFSHGGDSERHMYDVTAIAREVTAMVGVLGKYRNRELSVDRCEPCYAWINGPEIKQVVLNLVANAIDATAEGGSVNVSIQEDSSGVEVTVSDDGCGMTSEVIEHLFEPFYTTKDAGRGTGLGLSISHRIVLSHNGLLEADSEGPGKGSTFRLSLPKEPPGNSRAA